MDEFLERTREIGKILDGLPLKDVVSILVYNLAGALGQADEVDWDEVVVLLKTLVNDAKKHYKEIYKPAHDE